MSMMKAAVFLGERTLALEDRPVPQVVPGSLLLRILACAICGSDLRIFQHGNERVKPPRILGHEIAAEIVEVGAGVRNWQVGDRVAVGADVPCGQCSYCLSGQANCCDVNLAIGYQFDGGFAEYMLLDPLVVQGGPLQRISAQLPAAVAALAEPLACCLNGYEVGLMKPGRSVVVFGAGPIGIMLTLLAPVFEASQVIVIDTNPARLAFAKEHGASHTLNPQHDDVVAAVLRHTGGRGADMIFTACPDPQSHEQAIAMVSKHGVVNLFGGLSKASRPISFYSNQIHYREAYITGSHGSTPTQHKRAVELLETKRIRLDALLTSRLPLNAIHDAFAQAASGQQMKVVICPHEL